MSSDRTEHQSSEEQEKARDLSLESSQPPAQIPGYKLQKFIGSGAFGEVWSATSLKTGRRVAVKFFTRRTEEGVQQLMREVEKLLAATSDARYVVQLFDYGWDANPPYYVMDYIESGSLEDRLKSGGMPTSEAIELFQEVATGMMHLHGKGILHCDLKPGNVLLDQDGKPRVADFGQSRMKSDQTSALGTLFYMAPEQADMEAMPDAAWDVYGLGALTFSMLTGKPPYYSLELSKKIESMVGIEERLKTYREALMAAPKPTEHRQVPGVERLLADIVDRCIAPNPAKRFKNMQSVLLALRQRELARARRPLMVLGLVLPLLLTGILSLFAGYAFNQAIVKTEKAIIVKAKVSNQYAAELTATTAAAQIKEYFRVVRDLSRDQDFRIDFESFLNDESALKLRMEIADPRKNTVDGKERDPKLAQVRKQFKELKSRLKLQTYLDKRMSDRAEYPIAASWFVSDRFGNQVASDFGKVIDPNSGKVKAAENKTLGNNYAYRGYFTGTNPESGESDLARDDPTLQNIDSVESLSKRKIIDGPHLSAAFNSLQSKTWKVAFSIPVRTKDGSEILGIVAVTVDLGRLSDFKHSDTDFYTMLVDGRRGKYEGIILEHPLYTKVLGGEAKSGGRLPDDLFSGVFVDLDQVANDIRDENLFNDPVGPTKFGNAYGADSIVCTQPVVVRGAEDKHTKLFVLAVQDHENLMSDVEKLGSQLSGLAVFALLTLIGLGLAMWWFVNRLMRESRERLARTFSPGGDSSSSSLLEMETMLAAPQQTSDFGDGPGHKTGKGSDEETQSR